MKASFEKEATRSKWLIAVNVVSTLGTQRQKHHFILGWWEEKLRTAVVWNHMMDLGSGDGKPNEGVGRNFGRQFKQDTWLKKYLQRERESIAVLGGEWVFSLEERGEVTYEESGNYLLVNGESLIQSYGIWERKWHDPSSVFWRLIRYHYVLDYLDDH